MRIRRSARDVVHEAARRFGGAGRRAACTASPPDRGALLERLRNAVPEARSGESESLPARAPAWRVDVAFNGVQCDPCGRGERPA